MPQYVFTLAPKVPCLIDDADLSVTYQRAIEASEQSARGGESSEEWVFGGAMIGPDSEPCAFRLLNVALRMRHCCFNNVAGA